MRDRAALTRSVAAIKALENIRPDVIRHAGTLIADRIHIAARGAVTCEHLGTGYTLCLWMEETGHWQEDAGGAFDES
jgi:hypothetical protein